MDYMKSLMTHAMVLTGVDLDENGKSTSGGKLLGRQWYRYYFVTPDVLGWTNTLTKSLFVATADSR